MRRVFETKFKNPVGENGDWGGEYQNTKNEAAGYHELISQKENNLHVYVLLEILYLVISF